MAIWDMRTQIDALIDRLPSNALERTIALPDGVWSWLKRMGCIAGAHSTPQPDGTLLCPAGTPLYPQGQRPERDGSLRVVYAARIAGIAIAVSLREERQGYGAATNVRCCM
ncbi:hypothetical protein KSZ_39050 [Dictyobacter formicarum]|uniref:RES domain-containing protein n=1 Tax=Dictyobacter formicarum TaxID=2778368 RepID=A0ABQ3VJP1_9CHLR|nr:hypothetical protein KSZ_39050 [Dictyobacter formicarum]